jgi:hypothetical protein
MREALLYAIAFAILAGTVALVVVRTRRARRRAGQTGGAEARARRDLLRAKLAALTLRVPEHASMVARDLPALAASGEVEAHLLAHEPQQALAAAERAVAEAPESPAAHTLLALALLSCDALVPASAEITRARALGAQEAMLDHVEGRVDHLLWVRRVNPGNPEVQRSLTPPLVTPFDKLALQLARQRAGAPADAAVWLTGEGRQHELTLDAETIAELLVQHHGHGLRSLELLVAAAERAPESAELVYHAARRALQLGFVPEGRALFVRLEPLMTDSPERASFQRDQADLQGQPDLPPEPPLPPISPGARRSSKLVMAK